MFDEEGVHGKRHLDCVSRMESGGEMEGNDRIEVETVFRLACVDVL